MIHIDFPKGLKPPKKWRDKAAILTSALLAAPDDAARHKIMDANEHVWRELKEWLEKFSNGKCWFTEARDAASHWHVDHFRPKKAAKGPARSGYWWRAFDYRNFRLSGGVPNTGKAAHFPLKPGSFVASGPGDDCDLELSVLIDPTEKDDVDLIAFISGGMAHPASPDGWDRRRGQESIERYKLNTYTPLSRARQLVWHECRLKIEEVMRLYKEKLDAEKAGKQPSPVRKREIERLKREIAAMTAPEAEFSAVARALVLKNSNEWVNKLVI